MIRIFDYLCYKKFLNSYIRDLPAGGRGEYQKISKALKIHTTLTSQVFKGDRDLSLEQSYGLTEYLKLDRLETKYLLLLVSLGKAGTYKLQNYYKDELEQVKIEANKLSYRLKIKKRITEKESAVFYSDSIYSHVRLAAGLDSINSSKQISNYLSIGEDRIKEILIFLLKTGLVVEDESGCFKIGPSKIHLDKDSPFILNHHRNWRNKAIYKQSLRDGNDLFYTTSMSLSRKDFLRVKEEINKSLENIVKIVGPSETEEVYCLNIDCFFPR